VTEIINKSLNESDATQNPLDLFKAWYDLAWEHIHNANGMSLATVSPDGKPAVRVVLLKYFDDDGFVFYTNYNSEKSQHLEQQPYASLNLWWDMFERQIRVDGRVVKVSAQESDEYFHSRPRGSQIGAWASPQSEIISDRAMLEGRVRELEKRYGDGEIPRPPHWGGWCVIPNRIEFWQGRPDRLHDRLLYTRETDDGVWQINRLAP